MAGKVVEFTDANFQNEVISSDTPVLVDFWAPWCGPCKMIAPTIEELANDYGGKVKIGKLNTDENPNVASEYNISAIPTVMLFKGGQMVDKVMGVNPKDRFVKWIDSKVG
ncbi:thioredoxin family protein [Lacunimicrobium album]